MDTKRLSRYVASLVCKSKIVSVRNLARALASHGIVELSKSTVYRIMKANPGLSFRNVNRNRDLSILSQHKRIQWCQQRLLEDTLWANVIFVDEKRWCLDGPDGLSKQWCDCRNPTPTRKHRVGGGRSIMVWGGIALHGTTQLMSYLSTVNQDLYIKTLEIGLLPRAESIAGKNWILLQDNCPVHVGKLTKAWMGQNGVVSLQLPPYSPDLNPMENIWGILSMKVYGANQQYDTLAELEEAIQKAWLSEVTPTLVSTLVMSMKERCQQVIDSSGKAIKY
jgi:transposase